MMYIEGNRTPRRSFLKAGVGLGALTILPACEQLSPEKPKISSEIVPFPVELEMPLGNKLSLDTAETTTSPKPRLRLNKTLTQKLLEEKAVQKAEADWILNVLAKGRSLSENDFFLIPF